jgi:hypothetical protein
MNMSERGERHIVPAIVAIIGIVATLVLLYLILSIGAGFLAWLLGGTSGGTPAVAAVSNLAEIQLRFFG